MVEKQKAVTCCCCCGQVIPPKLQMPRIKQRIYEVVARHPEGLDREQIKDIVYADDPNGGPDGITIISTTVFQMNRDYLRPLGLEIRSRGGPGAVFKLQTLR